MPKIDGIKDVHKLIHGEHESQQKIQVSVPDKPVEYIKRDIGDKWTDANGDEWEQKNGYISRVTKFDEIREYVNSFQNCPYDTCKCNKWTAKRLDEKMRILKGLCFDCVIKMEHKIRLAGKWDEYEKGVLKENALSWLREAEADKNVIVDELSRLEFPNEFGDVEKWDTGNTKEELLNNIEESFSIFRKKIFEQVGGEPIENETKNNSTDI